jgi:hypothetical protein
VQVDSWISVVGVLVNGVGIGFVAFQVILARRQLRDGQRAEKREYDRLKRQATVDYVTQSRGLTWELRAKLPNDFDAEAVARYVEEAYATGDRTRLACLSTYLGHYESLAVGVANGTYDLPTTDSLIGARMIRVAETYQPYIQEVRRRTDAASLYIELEWLAAELIGLREARGGRALFAERDRAGYPSA